MTTPNAYSAGVTQPTDTTTAQPDPTEVGDATVDTTDPSGLALSDEANATLYPDVEHPDAPQLPPGALDDVPPPLVQQESKILDLLRAYGSGEADWPSTKQALIDFDYQQNPPTLGSPKSGPSQGDWYIDTEANAGTFAEPDTWGQLQEAADTGLLTRDEFNQVLAARAAKAANPENESK